MPNVPKIFLSHMREDVVYAEHALTHLQALKCEIWTCPPEGPAVHWAATLARAIENCDAALLFVTPSYLTSTWIRTLELPVLLQRAGSDCLHLFPVHVRRCQSLHTEFRDHQVFPQDGKPLSELSTAKQGRSWLELRESIERRLGETKASARSSPTVFIGHGRAAAWEGLRAFIQDQLKLTCEEFNRVPIAGITNAERLSQMLDSATIAFLVMTAEDEQPDGTMHARMNVIHEAGLFQGHLGFERAIVLLEEGCKAFSNIQGLGQIHFPAGNISAIFDDVRKVLKRECLIE